MPSCTFSLLFFKLNALINLHSFSIEQKYSKTCLVDKTLSLAEKHQHFKGVLSMRILDIRAFPFDFQDYHITIQSRTHRRDKMEIANRDDMFTMGYYPEHEWRVVGVRAELWASHTHQEEVFHELNIVISK